MLNSNQPLLFALILVGCSSNPAPSSQAAAPVPNCPSASVSDAASARTPDSTAPSTAAPPPSLRPWLGASPPAAQGANATSLDATLHRRLETAFGGVERGAGVVMDVDGTLRALFSTLPHNTDAGLAARHLATGRPANCGSVAKPFTAVAALAAGAMSQQTKHVCSGSLAIGKRRFRCYGSHGSLDLARAIILSDNIYFFQVARGMKHDAIADVQHAFGLGEPTQALPKAAAGFVPRARYYKTDGRSLRVDHTLSQAIGHGDIQVTPLQLARAYAALATGTLPSPSLRGAPAAGTPLKAAWAPHFEVLRAAVRRVVTDADGTAHFDGAAPNVAGKTGTAHAPAPANEKAPLLGWFAGWAPATAPRVAFAFRVEGKTGREVAEIVLPVVASP